MEISEKVPPLAKKPHLKQASKPAEKPTEKVSAAKGDLVTFSARARELQAAREAIARMDNMDPEKVARIKAQIKAGTYKVDAGKIAEKIIGESLLDDIR